MNLRAPRPRRALAVLVVATVLVVGSVPDAWQPLLPGPLAQIGRSGAVAAVDEVALRAQVGAVYDRLDGQAHEALREGRTDVPVPQELPAGVEVLDADGLTAGRCHEVLVVGVRGSGESASRFAGLGITVATAVTTIAEGLEGTDLGVLPLDYPATSVSRLVIAPQEYRSGIDRGALALKLTLRARAEACPHERTVLVGFSQGAMVVHKALDVMGSVVPELLHRVDAVLLISDGYHVPGDHALVFGAPADVAGAGHVLDSTVGPLPAALAGRVVEVCDAGDPVCSPSGLGSGAAAVHTGYKVGHRQARAAAVEVADLMRAV